jgi:hypothetical protein
MRLFAKIAYSTSVTAVNGKNRSALAPLLKFLILALVSLATILMVLPVESILLSNTYFLIHEYLSRFCVYQVLNPSIKMII